LLRLNGSVFFAAADRVLDDMRAIEDIAERLPAE